MAAARTMAAKKGYLMGCTDVLLQLLALGAINPLQVSEDEMRVAIAITARRMHPGEQIAIHGQDDATRKGLLQLFSEHPELRAVVVGGSVFVKRLSN